MVGVKLWIGLPCFAQSMRKDHIFVENINVEIMTVWLKDKSWNILMENFSNIKAEA